MRNITASFTRAERNLLVFVLAMFAGGSLLQHVMARYNGGSRLDLSTAAQSASSGALAPPTPAGLTAEGLIDVNVANGELLETLPHIGPAMSKTILRHREENGPFRTLEDLDKVPGIGPATLSKLKPLVTFGNTAGDAKPPQASLPATNAMTQSQPPPVVNSMASGLSDGGVININTATEAQLDSLHGVGPALARRIVEDRQQRGPFRSPADLDRVKGIGSSILQKNAGRISISDGF